MVVRGSVWYVMYVQAVTKKSAADSGGLDGEAITAVG